MFIEQLRCDYDISELFQEECVLGPTQPTVNSCLWADTVSTISGLVMSLYNLLSRYCECGLRRPLLEEILEWVCGRVSSATSHAGVVDPVGHRISSPLVVLALWLSWLNPIPDGTRLPLDSL